MREKGADSSKNDGHQEHNESENISDDAEQRRQPFLADECVDNRAAAEDEGHDKRRQREAICPVPPARTAGVEEVVVPQNYRCREEDDGNEREVDRNEMKDCLAAPARIRDGQLFSERRRD